MNETLPYAGVLLDDERRDIDRAGDDDLDDDGTEPYCTVCGQWAGMFTGLDGWQHFRGDPAPGGTRELYDAGHAVVPAFVAPPARSVSPAQHALLLAALDEAAAMSAKRGGADCSACGWSPAGVCGPHRAGLDRADAYRMLRGQLAAELTAGGAR